MSENDLSNILFDEGVIVYVPNPNATTHRSGAANTDATIIQAALTAAISTANIRLTPLPNLLGHFESHKRLHLKNLRYVINNKKTAMNWPLIEETTRKHQDSNTTLCHWS